MRFVPLSQIEEEERRQQYVFVPATDFEAPKPSGFFSEVGSAISEGTQKTLRSARAALSTYLGLDDDVVEQAGRTAQIEAGSQATALTALKRDVQARKTVDDESIWSGIRNVAGAIADNPRGGAQLVAEQAPNAVVSLGTGLAGAKAGALIGAPLGPAGAAVGGTVGFLAGLFGANTLLETGNKAVEAAKDQQFTPEERSRVIREGAVKGGVITAVDAATLGASRFVLGAANRAVEQATARVLTDAGVDAQRAAREIQQAQRQALTSSRGLGREATAEAVEKATVEAMGRQGLLAPDLVSAVQAAQKSAFDTATTFGKRAGRGGTALTLETLGEGVGEGLGEFAATGEFSPTDAALESIAGLSMSVPELYVAKRLDSPGILTREMSRSRPAAEVITPPPANLPQLDQQLGQAVDDLTQAVDPYLAVSQARTLDEAIQAAGAATTVDLTPPDVLNAARERALIERLEEAPQLPPLQPGQTRVMGDLPAFPDINPSGLQPGQARLLSPMPDAAPAIVPPPLRSVSDLPRPTNIAGVPASTITTDRLRTLAADVEMPAITRRGAQIELMAREQDEGAALVPPLPARSMAPMAAPPAAGLPQLRAAADREAGLLEQREGTPANPIPERLRVDAQRRDAAAELIESDSQSTPDILARANALRAEAQSLRTRADEIAAASAAGAQPAAGTQFEREQLDAQAAVNREMRLPAREDRAAAGFVDLTPMEPLQARQRLAVLQDQMGDPLSLEIVPHPAQEGRLAIARRALPVQAGDLDLTLPRTEVPPAQAQAQLEAAALAGTERVRRAEDAPRQAMIDRALAGIEARGGVASPYEAEILRAANMGQPFDRVDPSLGRQASTDEKLTAATGIAVGSEAGLGFGARSSTTQAPAPAPFQYADGRGRQRREETPAQDAPPADVAGAFVQQMRETATPAARAFVRDYEAGRIGDADVMQALEAQRGMAPSAQQRLEDAAGQAPSEAQGLQVAQGLRARGVNPVLADAVTLFGGRPVTERELTPEGAAGRLERMGTLARQPAQPAIPVERGLTPRAEFPGRAEAINTGAKLPRPSRVGGAPAATLSDEQLRAIAGNEALPAITRRGASIELMARRQEQGAQRGERQDAGDADARLAAAAEQGRLSQPSDGRVIVTGARLSTQRLGPGSRFSVRDGKRPDGTAIEHDVRVVEPSRLGNTGRLLQQIARIFGKRLVVFESDTLAADGFVQDGDNDTIFINASSQISPLAVFGHELTHLIKRDNPQAYAALQAVVQREIREGGLEQFAQEYGEGANIEELASDLVGNRFQEADFWQSVFDEIAAQNPEGARGIVQRLAAALTRAVNAFLKVARGPGFQADQYVNDLQAVKDAVRTALVDYTQSRREAATAMAREGAPGYDSDASTGDGNARFSQPRAGQGVSGAAEGDGRGAGQDGRGEPPRYGAPREGAISVVGRHYSTQQRATLNGAFYRTGIAGRERTRLDDSLDPRLNQRIYFYVDAGSGIRPEPGVGAVAHEVRLDNVYDPASGLIPRQDSFNAFESAVLNAGFDGYIAPFMNQRAVVLLGPKHTAVPVRALGRVASAPVGAGTAAAPTTLRKSLLADEIQAIDTARIPGAQLRSGSLVIPSDQTEAANAELKRIGSGARFSRQKLTPEQKAQQDADRVVSRAVTNEQRRGVAVLASAKPGNTIATVTGRKSKNLERLHARAENILRAKPARDLLDRLGVKSYQSVTYNGSWQGEPELSFFITAKDKNGNPLDFDRTRGLATLFGWAFQQDAAITSEAVAEVADGATDIVPAVYFGRADGAELTAAETRAAFKAFNAIGEDASVTPDGKALKFLYFGDEAGADAYVAKLRQVAKKVGLAGESLAYNHGILDSFQEEANGDVTEGYTRVVRETWDSNAPAGSPGILERATDSLLVPYILAIRAEGFGFDYARWQQVNGATRQQRRELEAKVAAAEAANRHGLVPRLREKVNISRLPQVPTEARITQKTTNVNAQEQLGVLDDLLSANPNPLASARAWLEFEAQAFGSNDVPVAPRSIINQLTDAGQGILTQLRRLTPGQIADASDGFANGRAFRRLYESKQVPVETTGKLMMWSFLSRGVSPYVQEAMFLDAVRGVEPFVRAATQGNFGPNQQAEYTRWAEGIARRNGSASPGNGTTHNLNAFGKSFLTRMSERMPDGRTKLQYLHDMFSDPNMTGKQIRREFVQIGEGVGIDNKVISFTLLVIGHTDVVVLDRVQMKNVFDDGSFANYNLYDGTYQTALRRRLPPSVSVVDDYGVAVGNRVNQITDDYGNVLDDKLMNKLSTVETYATLEQNEGEADAAFDARVQQALQRVAREQNLPAGDLIDERAIKPGSGLASMTTGVRGLMLYETIESELQRVLPRVYGELGRAEDASPGRWHWESWVVTSGQEASHGTLDALLHEVEGRKTPFADVTVKQGEYGNTDYGVRYARDTQNRQYYLYDDSQGNTYRFTPPAWREWLGEVKKVFPRDFKVSMNEDRSERTEPWFMDPRVDRAKVDEVTRRIGTPETRGITASRRRQTDTPEFRRWFGDSKVVNGLGEPRVVYHGTAGDVAIFDMGRAGQTYGLEDEKAFFFTGRIPTAESAADDATGLPAYARKYAYQGFGGGNQGDYGDDYSDEPYDISADYNGGQNLMPVYLSLQNPLIIDAPYGQGAGAAFENGREAPGQLIERAKREGYDGIIIRGKYRNREQMARILANTWTTDADKKKYLDELARKDARKHQTDHYFIAFRPDQIKSAIGNIGAFGQRPITAEEAERFGMGEMEAEYRQYEGDIRFSPRRNIFGQRMALANWTAPSDTKLDRFLYTMQDKQIDTKRVVQAIKAGAGAIDDEWNAYLQEELYHGRTAKQTKAFLGDELRPLLQDMQARGVSVADLETYLHNRHAEERNRQIARINPAMPDEGSGIKTADARAYLAGLDPAKRRAYEALARRVDAITAGTRSMLVASGLETQDTIDQWERTYGSYVPLMREDLDFALTSGGMGTGQGYQVRGAASRRATGSTRPVVDILANVAMQRERAVVRAEKARVARAVYGLAVQYPNTSFWLAVDPAGQKDPNKAMADLMAMGINPIDAQNIVEEPTQPFVDPRTGLVTQRVNPLLRNSDNVLAVRIDGQEKYVFFNANDERSQRMAAALKNLDADQLGRVMSLTAQVTRYFASINTQYNPIFGAINFLRDVQGAALNLSTTPIAGDKAKVLGNAMLALRGIYSDLRSQRAGRGPATGTWATLWEEFQREGGQTGFRDMFSRSEERAQALERILDPSRWADTPLGKVFTVNGTLKVPMELARKTAAPVFDWLSDYNETMENAVRLAAYKAAKDRGMSAQQSASLAKNLTVNFNRKGQVATQAGALYAFFNASVQGTARLAETLRGPAGRKIIAGGLLLGTAQAMLLAAAGFDEDEPPEFVKERNLVIPTGDGKYLTIPMPLGFNVLPNTSRVITEWAMSGWRDPAKRVGQITGAFLEMFNPIGNAGWSVQTIAPTVADPLVALAENRDWTGKPIAKEDRSGTDPTPGYTRAKETASGVSKALAEFFNLASGGTQYKPGLFSPTPDQIDYLIGQATGGVGREALKIEQSITSSITGEELPTYKVPVLGRFYGDARSSAAESSRFYANITRLNQHENEIEGRRKDREDVAGYLAENPEARLVSMANQVERQVQDLRRRKREMLERDASSESIKMIEAQITARMKRLNDRVRQVRDAETVE